jgi:hypothetical protein
MYKYTHTAPAYKHALVFRGVRDFRTIAPAPRRADDYYDNENTILQRGTRTRTAPAPGTAESVTAYSYGTHTSAGYRTGHSWFVLPQLLDCGGDFFATVLVMP